MDASIVATPARRPPRREAPRLWLKEPAEKLGAEGTTFFRRGVMGLNRSQKTPSGFCFIEYYTRQDCLTPRHIHNHAATIMAGYARHINASSDQGHPYQVEYVVQASLAANVTSLGWNYRAGTVQSSSHRSKGKEASVGTLGKLYCYYP
ncbi:RNA recognition domain-containing protein [Paraphaeosphaeria sporulosa]